MPLLLMCFRFPNIVHSQDLAALLEWPLLWGRDGILFKHLSKLRNISLHREIGNTQKSIDHIAHIQVTNPLGILTVGFITLLRFRVFWMGQSYPADFLKDIKHRYPKLTGGFHTTIVWKRSWRLLRLSRRARNAPFCPFFHHLYNIILFLGADKKGTITCDM